MESSAQRLMDAVMNLSTSDMTDYFGEAGEVASKISYSFEDVNNELVEGWRTSQSFNQKIRNNICNELKGLKEKIEFFSEETVEGEIEATTAAEEANDTAQSILGELETSMSDTNISA